jgi:hypothetical protein
VRDERNDAHVPATEGAQQREHLVDTGYQHRPQVVRRALGRHLLGRLGLSWESVAYPKCALAHACTRAGWLGLHLRQWRRLHRCALRHLINTVEEKRNAISDSCAIRTSALLNRVTTFTTIAAAEAAVDGMKYLEASGVARGVISVQEMHGRLAT